MDKCNLLISLVLLLVGGLSVEAQINSLERLCLGSLRELNTVAQYDTIIETIKTGDDNSACSSGEKQSILELEPIVRSENVCSIEMANLIGQYYQKYVAAKAEARKQILSSVKRFFLSVGFQVSKLCLKSLMVRLESISQERTSPDDRRALFEYNGYAKNLSELILGPEMAIQNLFLVIDMDNLIEGKSKGLKSAKLLQHNNVILVDQKTKTMLDELKSKCLEKFKPIYDKLLSPLVILTNLGFEFSEGSVGEAFEEFKQKDVYKDWTEAVLICETTLKQKVIAQPIGKHEQEGARAGSIAILDDEDLAVLKEETGVEVEHEEASLVANEYQVSVRLRDSVDMAGKELLGEVGKFSKKRKQADRMRRKLIKRLAQNVKQLIDFGEVRFGLEKSPEVESRKRWAKKALVCAGVFGFFIGVFTGSFPLFLTSILLLIVLLGLQLGSDEHSRH